MASTHAGLSCPPFPVPTTEDAPVVGIGYSLAALCNPGLPLLSLPFGPPCVAIEATGVGQSTAVCKSMPPCLVFICEGPVPFRLVGVGQSFAALDS